MVEEEQDTAGRFGLSVAYFGETITHPGFRLGGEWSVVDRPKYALIAGADLGFYSHKRSHTALFTDVKFGVRGTTRSGLYLDVFAGIGYFHTWVNGDVYVQDGDGVALRGLSAGRPHVMPNGSFGLGWDFSRKTELPLSVFVSLAPFSEYPFNTKSAMHAALLVGATWRFRSTGQEQ